MLKLCVYKLIHYGESWSELREGKSEKEIFRCMHCVSVYGFKAFMEQSPRTTARRHFL